MPRPTAAGRRPRSVPGTHAGAARCRFRYAARGARGSPRPCASSTTCRWSRPRGSTRSAAGAARGPSSACACGGGRSACRTAPGRAGIPRPDAGSSAQAPQLVAVGVELLALLLEDVGRRVVDEALVRKLLLPALHLRAELLPARVDARLECLRIHIIRREDSHGDDRRERLATV